MSYNHIVKYVKCFKSINNSFSCFIHFEYLAPRKDVDDVEMFERRIHVSLDTLDQDIERGHGQTHGHRHHVRINQSCTMSV